MTLVLLIGTADHAITVADRRLTSGSEVVDDDSNKLAVLVTRGARVSVGFSGLAADRRLSYQPAKMSPDVPPMSAYVGLPGSATFRTGAWLPDTLADEAHAAGYELAPLVRRFAQQSSPLPSRSRAAATAVPNQLIRLNLHSQPRPRSKRPNRRRPLSQRPFPSRRSRERLNRTRPM